MININCIPKKKKKTIQQTMKTGSENILVRQSIIATECKYRLRVANYLTIYRRGTVHIAWKSPTSP